jgi:hypothetical protein
MIGVDEEVNWAMGETVSSGKFILDKFRVKEN